MVFEVSRLTWKDFVGRVFFGFWRLHNGSKRWYLHGFVHLPGTKPVNCDGFGRRGFCGQCALQPPVTVPCPQFPVPVPCPQFAAPSSLPPVPCPSSLPPVPCPKSPVPSSLSTVPCPEFLSPTPCPPVPCRQFLVRIPLCSKPPVPCPKFPVPSSLSAVPCPKFLSPTPSPQFHKFNTSSLVRLHCATRIHIEQREATSGPLASATLATGCQMFSTFGQ